MISSLIQHFRNLQMKYQVMIIETFALGITLILILCTYSVQSNIFFKFYQSSSYSIVIKQQKNQALMASYQTEAYLQIKNFKSVYNLASLYDFFHYSNMSYQNYQINTEELNNPCVFQNQIITDKIRYGNPTFCYQVLNSTDYINLPSTNARQQYFIKTISLLSEYSLLLSADTNSKITIFDTPTNTLFYGYPYRYIFLNYDLTTRPWFKYHNQQMKLYPNQLFFFSPVFQSVTKDFMGGVSFSLLDDENNLVGLFDQIIQVSDQSLQSLQINVILVNSQGQILINGLKNLNGVQQNLYIFNESLTGFNYTDWIEMYYYSINKTYQTSQCNNINNTFCLYNKFYNQSVYLDTQFIQSLNSTLIIYGNVTNQIILDEKINHLAQDLQQNVVQNLWIQCICCSILILISGICIHYMFQPLLKLMEDIRQHAIKVGNNINKEILKILNIQQKPKNIFSKLGDDFANLIESIDLRQNKKSQQCEEIENIEYNKKDFTAHEYNKIRQNIKPLLGLNIDKIDLFSLNDLKYFLITESRAKHKFTLIQE